MRTVPPEVILSWPNPNYTDPTTRGNALVIVNAIFISIAVIVVLLRLYTRIWIKCWFGSDDAFIVLALISTIGLAATVLLANQSYGWNRHIYDVPFNQLEPASKIAMAAKLIFTSAATFTRLSLLFFYYRLIQDGGRPLFRWAVHANVALSVAIFIAFFFLAIFLCSPVKNYWTFGAPPGSCLDEGKATLAAGIINCVADLLCTVTPIPLVISLQMPRRQRILVNLLFSLGFIVTIAGVVRTWFIYKCFIADYDQTWYSYPLWIAAAIEIDLGVICASAPVLRPLIAKVPGCLFSITSSLSGKSRSSPNHSDHTAQGSKIGVPTGTMLKSDAGTTRPGESDPGLNVFGQQYEMGTWVDIEGGHRPSATLSRGSQDAILTIGGSANDPVSYTNVRSVR